MNHRNPRPTPGQGRSGASGGRAPKSPAGGGAAVRASPSNAIPSLVIRIDGGPPSTIEAGQLDDATLASLREQCDASAGTNGFNVIRLRNWVPPRCTPRRWRS
jgi:hypothetical protein